MEIKLARPCLEDPGRYIAESNIGYRISMEKACSFLSGAGTCISNLKCSIRLGVIRFELDDRSIMIYRNGRMDIRRVSTVDEAGKIVKQVIRLIQPALE